MFKRSMFKRLSGSFLLAAFAGAAFAQSTFAQSNRWELGHPDAKLMIGIDLKGLRESAAGRAFSEQMKAQAPQTGPAAIGMGFLNQVDRIFISSPALPPVKMAEKAASGKTHAPAAAATNPPFLMMVEGTLPLQQLLAFLPGTSHRYHEVEIFRGSKANDASLAMLDMRTILVGDAKSVEGAIDRRGKALPVPSALLKRAEALASTHEIWIIASDSLSKFQPQGSDASNALASKIASQIKGLDMALSVRDGIELQLAVATENETVANQMAQMLSGQLSLAMLTQTADPWAADMAKRLHVDTEGAHVRVSFALTADEFAEQLRKSQTMMTARAGVGAHGADVQTSSEPAKPQPKPVPGKVKIYGLDEGVKEIQLH